MLDEPSTASLICSYEVELAVWKVVEGVAPRATLKLTPGVMKSGSWAAHRTARSSPKSGHHRQVVIRRGGAGKPVKRKPVNEIAELSLRARPGDRAQALQSAFEWRSTKRRFAWHVLLVSPTRIIVRTPAKTRCPARSHHHSLNGITGCTFLSATAL